MTTTSTRHPKSESERGRSPAPRAPAPEIEAGEEDELSSDEETIFLETGHLADRDGMALNGNRIVQGGSTADVDDSWAFDRKDRLLGDSDHSSDAVDAQFAAVGQITEDIVDPATHHDPTPAIPLDHRNEFDRFSDEELLRMADVLGIPDRTKLMRPKLIERIRHYEARGL